MFARIYKAMGYDMKQMEAFLREADYRDAAAPAAQEQTQAAESHKPETCSPVSLNLEKHKWSWDSAACAGGMQET